MTRFDACRGYGSARIATDLDVNIARIAALVALA